MPHCSEDLLEIAGSSELQPRRGGDRSSSQGRRHGRDRCYGRYLWRGQRDNGGDGGRRWDGGCCKGWQSRDEPGGRSRYLSEHRGFDVADFGLCFGLDVGEVGPDVEGGGGGGRGGRGGMAWRRTFSGISTHIRAHVK